MDQNKLNLITSILNVIRNNEILKEKIIIKGGISISLLLDLEDRETKDLDTYIFSNDMKKIIDIFIESLKKAKIESRYIEGKTPKLVFEKDEFEFDRFEITFKKLESDDEIIEKDGLKMVDPRIIALDKVDRFSRLWKNQISKSPKENFENIINKNYHRDLFDIFSIRNEIQNVSVEEFRILFNKWKIKSESTKSNYKHNSIEEMFEKFHEAVNYLINEKLYYNNSLKTFEKIIKKDLVPFKQNFNSEDYDECMEYLISLGEKFLK